MTLLWYLIAAFAEIAGCFVFWAWARLDKSALWLIPGLASLALFAWILTRADSAVAGRAYGGVYIASSMVWMWLVEGQRPDRWDMAGLALCLIGSAVILLPSRT
jgi:small multidrug resistance family-3 protein